MSFEIQNYLSSAPVKHLALDTRALKFRTTRRQTNQETKADVPELQYSKLLITNSSQGISVWVPKH